jgi:hypothetical protein
MGHISIKEIIIVIPKTFGTDALMHAYPTLQG